MIKSNLCSDQYNQNKKYPYFSLNVSKMEKRKNGVEIKQ